MGWLNKPFTTFNEKSPLANNASKAFARNYEDLVSHPVSSSTGGLLGGDSGVIDFSNAVDGAGVENNSLKGGLSNKNNRYGLIALATYLGANYGLGGSGGESAAGAGGGASAGAGTSAGASGAGAGSGAGGWQQYMKMGSGMGGMGGMGGGGGQGGSSNMDESQRLQQETSDYMEKRRQEEEAKRLEEEKARLLAQAVRGGYGY